MRIVLDTNVLIAAFISHGVCNELLEHCMLNHKVFISDFILDEMRRKLTGKFAFTERESNAAVSLVRSRSTSIQPTPLARSVSRDPDDDSIIATAEAGQCACIVTGDKDLLDLEKVGTIRIISPSSFWKFEERERS